jgi:hypothetical protein
MRLAGSQNHRNRRYGILSVLWLLGGRAQPQEIGDGHHDGGLAAEVDHFIRSGVRPPGFVTGGLPGSVPGRQMLPDGVSQYS